LSDDIEDCATAIPLIKLRTKIAMKSLFMNFDVIVISSPFLVSKASRFLEFRVLGAYSLWAALYPAAFASDSVINFPAFVFPYQRPLLW